MIKDFIWFFKESKKFTGYSYKRIIFKENGLKKAISFVKNMQEWYNNYDRTN